MKNLSNNWKTLALNGFIALLYGVLALFVPKQTVIAVVMYFGIVILIIGLIMLFGAISHIKNKLPWQSEMLLAIATLIVGAIITFYSEKTLTVFVVIIGIWAIIVGISQLYYALKYEMSRGNKNSMLFNGILMLVFGIILFFNPFETASFLVILSGIIAVIMGIVLIVLAFTIRDIIKDLE